MRPDYCPMANEPCQSMCDTPCSAHRLKIATEAPQPTPEHIKAMQQAQEALEYQQKPLCMCFAGCDDCDPAKAPNADEAITALQNTLKDTDTHPKYGCGYLSTQTKYPAYGLPASSLTN